MDLQLINTELSEARLFRASRHFSSLTGKDITNLLYLNTLATYIMSQDSGQMDYALKLAKDTSQYTGYSLFRTHATDIYMLAYQIAHPNNDHAKVKSPVETKAYLGELTFNERLHYRFMKDLSNKLMTPQRAYTYLYRLETQLKVTDSRYKRWRRLSTDWNTLKYQQKQMVIAQLVQELRRIGNGTGVRGEIMFGLGPMLTYKKYNDVAPVTQTKPKAVKQPSVNTGRGIGTIASYWANQRKKK